MSPLLYAAIAPALACALVMQLAFLLKQRGAWAVIHRSSRPSVASRQALLGPLG